MQSHGTESQSYFYVVWPEENLSSASDSISSLEDSPQSEILDGTSERQEIVPQNGVCAVSEAMERIEESGEFTGSPEGLGTPQRLDSQPYINEIGVQWRCT